MARATRGIPVGGADAIVIKNGVAQPSGLYGALVVLSGFVLYRGYSGAQTSTGRIAATIFGAVLIALWVALLIRAAVRRSRLFVSAETIVFASPRGDTLTLYRQTGSALRIVKGGTARRPAPGLTNTEAEAPLPLNMFSLSSVRTACQSKGWQFPS